MILSQFDPSRKAIINPEDLLKPQADFPELVVSCFARETFSRLVKDFSAYPISRTSIANQEIIIYQADYRGLRIGLFNSVVGASACVAVLEDLIALGMKKLVLFGTCGILDEQIEETSIIVPTAAIRDEGTSYHYVAASDEIPLNVKTQERLLASFDKSGLSYSQGKVWTTDGIYRETPAKLAARKAADCICVDMEASAVAALADFRAIELCHFFYAADHLSAEHWDPRSLDNLASLDEKDKIAAIAMDLAYDLAQES